MDECFALLARNNRSQAVYYSSMGDRRQALKLCLQSLVFSCSPENLGFWLRTSVRLLARRIRAMTRGQDAGGERNDMLPTGRRIVNRPNSGARI